MGHDRRGHVLANSVKSALISRLSSDSSFSFILVYSLIFRSGHLALATGFVYSTVLHSFISYLFLFNFYEHRVINHVEEPRPRPLGRSWCCRYAVCYVH